MPGAMEGRTVPTYLVGLSPPLLGLRACTLVLPRLASPCVCLLVASCHVPPTSDSDPGPGSESELHVCRSVEASKGVVFPPGHWVFLVHALGLLLLLVCMYGMADGRRGGRLVCGGLELRWLQASFTWVGKGVKE